VGRCVRGCSVGAAASPRLLQWHIRLAEADPAAHNCRTSDRLARCAHPRLLPRRCSGGLRTQDLEGGQLCGGHFGACGAASCGDTCKFEIRSRRLVSATGRNPISVECTCYRAAIDLAWLMKDSRDTESANELLELSESFGRFRAILGMDLGFRTCASTPCAATPL